MKINVEGVLIELTESQVSEIEKVKRKRKAECSTFAKTLKYFGFKPSEGNKDCFEHDENGWWAEIVDYGNYRIVWMVGQGLKQSNSMPGGWGYSTPEQIEKEITKFLTNTKTL